MTTQRFLHRLLITCGLCLPISAWAATPVPRVQGPIAETPTSYPFGGAAHERVPEDLGKVGYIEEEYFLSGTANVYDWPQPGPAVVRTANAPYTTRVLVRRPISAGRFSGNVVVEMANPSNLFDLNLGWTISHKEFVRNGDAWVLITAKPVAVVTLKKFNPERYASLSFANPLPLDDPANCTKVSADSSRETENGLVWDMFSQTAAWIRSSDPSNPFSYKKTGSPNVKHVYAWGYSQTGSFLYTYVNAIHPLDVRANGRPLFDAYLIAVSSGPSPINQCAEPLKQGDPRRWIRNAGVPVVRVMSQSDYLSGIAARRDDSDAKADPYRNYEIAGSGHATPDELAFAAAPDDLIKGGRSVPPMDCNEGPRSRFPSSIAFNAIYHNLNLWVTQNKPAPRAQPILVKDGAAVLDPYGNVQGGVRSPFVDVPTSRWYGNSTGQSFCMIAGHEVVFDAGQLKQLYPTHQDYVRAVTENVTRLEAQGWIMKADGDDLIRDAKQSSVPSK